MIERLRRTPGLIVAAANGSLGWMRVLIVPDKFKGTLTAQEAAAAMAEGWRSARPGDVLETMPMSDGGDGFGEIMGTMLGAEERAAETVNAAHEPVRASWWWSAARNTAIVESARAIGLAMLPMGRFHPFELDSYGLGVWLRQIAAEHPRADLVVGIGGSATNDGGFGMARALGYRFLGDGRGAAGTVSHREHVGTEIRRWADLVDLAGIDVPVPMPNFGRITIACDVQNPLLGPLGASRIYGPQKGLRPQDMAPAEANLQRLAEVVARDLGRDAAQEPGAGAAGGLGFGLRAFLAGCFEPGFDIFARLARLEERIAAADLVVTGEGCIDEQTQMGKGTGAVAAMAKNLGIRCVGLAGLARKRGGLFTAVHGVHPDLASLEAALAEPARWVRELGRKAAGEFGSGS